MTQFHPNPKQLWEEYYRVVAPVVVLNRYDYEQEYDNQSNQTNGTIRTNNRKSQESRDTST